MATWASLTRDATWLSRLQSDVIYPATLLYLDWPTGEVRASTHHKSLTILGQNWTGVGNVAFINPGAFSRDGALVRYTVGLASLPQQSITPATEKNAIGRRAIMYLALFDSGWENPVAEQVFFGHVRTTGDFKFRQDIREDGTTRTVVDASVEIANGRNPRRTVALYHSAATADPSDTSYELLHTVGKALRWPA